MIEVDLSQLEGWARAVAEAPERLQDELTAGSETALHEGVGYAQEYAPRGDSGNLAGSIRILDGPKPDGGSYGTDLEYAAQREYGGTIYPRNKKALVFEIDGELIFAKSVTQEGSEYMKRSTDSMEQRVKPIYQQSVNRALKEL